MKKKMKWFSLLVGWLVSFSVLAQSEPTTQKMSVQDRMARARAVKADRKATKSSSQNTDGDTATLNQTKPYQGKGLMTQQKATKADYTAPVVKTLKGPHGEVVHTGEKGGKYYINQNGNKTYLSSNQ